MNPSKSEEHSVPHLVSRLGRGLRPPAVWLGLVLLGVVLSVWWDTHAQLDLFRSDIARRLAEGDSLAKEARAAGRQNQEAIASLQAKIGVLEARLAEAQSQQLALEAMYQEFSRSRDDRMLAEIEQSLSIAAQQLQLAGNTEAALIALQEADSRLAGAARPQLLALRKLIASDIARLRATPSADTSGISLKLESVIASIDTLPFAFEHRPKAETMRAKRASAPEPTNFWTTLAADFWNEARQLVRIQRVDAVDPGVLPPDQAFFLRENLKLRLVNARLSMLARDTSSFREDLRQARTWLEKYFDMQTPAVQSAATTLKSLSTFDAAHEVPSLAETLNEVRSLRSPRGRS